MNTLEDKASAVRKGQELDLNTLGAYLSSQLNHSEKLEISQFPSGYSNLTYLIKSGQQQFVLRRPPSGTKAKSANDMSREYRVLSGLNGHYSYAPELSLFCEDETIIGAPFYLMEYISGLIVRADYPIELSAKPEFVAAQSRQFVAALAELHAVDYISAGLAELGRPEGYTERQIGGWAKRYTNALTPGTSDFQNVIQWLQSHLADESGNHSLIHNDYKMDNIIWDSEQPKKMIGLLDWELATLGDPLMDLGATLGYWIEAGDPENLQSIRNMPSNVPGALSRRELLNSYAVASGREISTDHFDFYYIYGLFRRAAICQQIYYRFHHGQTTDQRFASLPNSVAALEAQAKRVMAGEI